MTDLLASLVDRALDRTAVLQRRQPTLFEPVAETSFGEQSKPGNISPLEEKEIIVESRPSFEQQKHFVNNSSRLLQPSLRRDEPESQSVETRPTLRRRADDNPPPQNDRDKARLEPVSTVSRKEVVKGVPFEEPRRELKTPVVAKAEEITIARPRLIETIVERRVEREIIKEHSKDQPAIKGVHTVAEPNSQPKPRDDDGVQPKPPFRPEVKQLTQSKEPAVIKPLGRQKPVPRQDPPPFIRAVSHAESKHAPKHEPPPVIHVTIGRVEVRATTAAANKSPVAQRPGPKMSLEEYLRSRGGGN
jgi:hypothetical protein